LIKFKPENFKENVPNGKSGIYMLLGSEKEILYIGKSKNLRSRLGNYFGTSCSWKFDRLEDFNHLFKFVMVEYIDNGKLVEEEIRLIKINKPPLNVNHNELYTKKYEWLRKMYPVEQDTDLEDSMKNFRN
jgi:excinuclease UvrABC nuclease subunit